MTLFVLLKNDPLISDWLDQQTDRTEMERIIALTETLDAPTKRTKAEVWDMLVNKINADANDNLRILAPSTAKKPSNRWIYYAACITAIFLIGFFGIKNTPEPISVSSEIASTIEYILPDESIVILNANSSISFIEKVWEENRELSLTGEAFFDVEEGSTFKVFTNSGEVTVLGTSFNIKERDGLYEVICATGKVSVSSKDEEVILTSGKKAFINNGILQETEVNINEIGAWRTGDFYFNQAPLETVINELERQFEIEIEMSSDITERIYNGYFNKENLTETSSCTVQWDFN